MVRGAGILRDSIEFKYHKYKQITIWYKHQLPYNTSPPCLPVLIVFIESLIVALLVQLKCFLALLHIYKLVEQLFTALQNRILSPAVTLDKSMQLDGGFVGNETRHCPFLLHYAETHD